MRGAEPLSDAAPYSDAGTRAGGGPEEASRAPVEAAADGRAERLPLPLSAQPDGPASAGGWSAAPLSLALILLAATAVLLLGWTWKRRQLP